MRCLLSLFIAAGLFCFGISAVTAQTSGNLRGLETENEAFAWRAIGRLDTEELGFCTATLIAPDIVLTAAHCVVFEDTGQKVQPEKVVFRAGFRQGTTVAERIVSQIEVHKDYDPAKGSTVSNIRHDAALLRLAQPILTSELNPLVVYDKNMPRGSVSLVSYGKDRETLPSRQDRCDIKGAVEGIVMLDCDVTFGSSGAPVLREAYGSRQIVSIISGGGVIDGERLSFGMVLPDLVAQLSHQMWVNKPRPKAAITRIQAGSRSSDVSSSGAKFVRP